MATTPIEKIVEKTKSNLTNTLSLPVRVGGAKRLFKSVEQLNKFIKQEKDAWGWLADPGGADERHIKKQYILCQFKKSLNL